jgi:asparagine synthase (glutamine-hydrolysing)
MCGIAAAFTSDPTATQRIAPDMDRILHHMQYRGPDASGLWIRPHVLMGHRRLSIIDLSDSGTQPLHDPENDLHIVFNGEIYNYQEIRQDLVQRGYRLKTGTDTEVILGAYHIYGKSFVARLRGMFAFVLYDGKDRTVLLSRDRLGKKPLFYCLTKNSLFVSSEIKFFHGFRDLSLTVDPESVSAFFSLQYIPGPWTIYREVQTVMPGECIQLDISFQRIEHDVYWSIGDRIHSCRESSTNPRDIDQGIEDSVRYRLIADVEIGILLSGGIDSSLLTSYATAVSSSPLKAFLVSFRNRDLDESEYAKMVAKSLGIELVDVDGGNLDEDLYRRVIYHADQPLGDPACVPTFLISKKIAEHVKVVLSGEGADELFWGYSHYRDERFAGNLFPNPATNWAKNRMDSWLTILETTPRLPSFLGRAAKLFRSPREIGSSRWTSVFGPASLTRLLPSMDWQQNFGNRHLDRMKSLFDSFRPDIGASDTSILLDLFFWLPDNLLSKVDRMTMAHSIEARTPYLDHMLVEKAICLPSRYKIDRFTGKKILRNLLEEKLPANLSRQIAIRKKHGFDVPLAEWILNPLRGHTEECFQEDNLRAVGILNRTFIRAMWESMKKTSKPSLPFSRKIWLLICFLTWYQYHRNKFGFK